MGHLPHITCFALAGALLAPALSGGAPRPVGGESLDTVIVRHLRSTSASTVSDIRLVVEPGDTIRAMIRLPLPSASAPERKHPLAFLVVGLETGKDVVGLIEDHDEVIAFGMDYPFEGDFELSGWKSFGTAWSLRQMAARTVRNIHLALGWLTTLPLVDTSDVTMIAVSFGVFTGVPAAAADPRVKRLAVVQGGGRIDDIIAANSERLGIGLPAWLAGKLGQGLLATFEPNDHIGKFAPRPFVLVSSDSDRFFPGESVKSLFDAARQPKEWMKYESPHVMPGERELIRELTRLLARKLYGGEQDLRTPR